MTVWAQLILVLLGCGLLTGVASAWLTARLFLRPPRMTDGKAVYLLNRVTPADIGLAFSPISFDVRDERTGGRLNVAGWWLPATPASDRTVVLLHGFADAKVGAIAWAPTLLAMGMNVLAIDLRAHGESDGTVTSAGFYERHDVTQVVDRLRRDRPRETVALYLYGVSLGSAVAIATAALRDDVAGVVLDSPYADYRDAMRTYAGLIGAPGGPVVALATRLAAWQAGADYTVVRPIDLVTASKCPVLVFQGTGDPFTDPTIRAAFATAIAGAPLGSRQVVLEGVGHLKGLLDAQTLYAEAIKDFMKPQL